MKTPRSQALREKHSEERVTRKFAKTAQHKSEMRHMKKEIKNKDAL
jgi:hypothetical protein